MHGASGNDVMTLSFGTIPFCLYMILDTLDNLMKRVLISGPGGWDAWMLGAWMLDAWITGATFRAAPEMCSDSSLVPS